MAHAQRFDISDGAWNVSMVDAPTRPYTRGEPFAHPVIRERLRLLT
nr:hypothetical protein [Kibdelosporangium sp. MJ126-NF4]CEL18339.1 hypothetical protein [Kibdelosporangium sp. MJ126-NF4]CTQ97823.1 hypothetical protein [Kibdelosporangium sp. MJ126-NF4]